MVRDDERSFLADAKHEASRDIISSYDELVEVLHVYGIVELQQFDGG